MLRKLRLLLLFNPLTEWIDRTKIYRSLLHRRTIEAERKEEDVRSRDKIGSFVRLFNINMDDFDPSDIHKYKSFQDFFIRKHAINSRPVSEPENPVCLII